MATAMDAGGPRTLTHDTVTTASIRYIGSTPRQPRNGAKAKIRGWPAACRTCRMRAIVWRSLVPSTFHPFETNVEEKNLRA